MRTDHDDRDDEFDRLLRSSTPPITHAPDELAELSSRVRVAARRAPRPRWSRAAIGVALAAMLGLGGVSTAAAVASWLPWAEDPDAVSVYRLPSGAWCEARIGNVSGKYDKEDLIQAVREFLADIEPITPADVSEQIAEIRGGENWIGNGPSPTPAGYGTPYYMTPDEEYSMAVSNVMADRVGHFLESGPYDASDANLSWETETHCPGAQW